MHVHVTVDLDGTDLVVVKSAVTPEAIDRLRVEAERLERAAHPGVVALLAAGPLPSGDPPTDAVAAPEFVVRLAHAGEPVTRWSASLNDLAGVAAALATTLADLHDAGIVHGRVEASHVLVGEDGRPRLCGLSGTAGATAADDVAGWGRLVTDLIARARTPGRGVRVLARPRHRGRRAALLQVAEAASDPVPGRRPTARAVADAVMTAVPDAALPRRAVTGQALTDRTDGGAGRERRRAGAPGWTGGTDGRSATGWTGDETAELPSAGADVDTLDRIWSWPGEPSEDERWAAVFGTAARGGDRSGDQAVPLADRGVPGWHTSTDDDRSPEALDLPADRTGRRTGPGDTGAADRLWSAASVSDVPFAQPTAGMLGGPSGSETGGRPAHLPDDPEPDGRAVDDDEPWTTPRSGAAPAEPARPEPPDAAASAPDDDEHLGAAAAGRTDRVRARGTARADARRERAGHRLAGAGTASDPNDDERSAATDDGPPHSDPPHSGPPHGDPPHSDPPHSDLPHDDPRPGDLPTRDHRPVGRARRTAARSGPPVGPHRRGRRVAVGTAGAVAVLAAGAWAAAAAGDGRPGGGADASRAPAARPDCPPVAVPAADVDGDGCREALVVDGATVDAGVAAWTIGEPGDLVALGDWDCDGEASPAVLRPASGDVFVFSTWAALDEPVTVPPVGRVAGGRAIRTEPTADPACHRLVVERADGTASEVEVRPGG